MTWFEPAERAARARAHARLAAHAWPRAASEVLATLRAAGGRAVFVGGVVRDVLLGRAVRGDLDIATSLTPAEVRACFPHVVPVGEPHGTLLVLHGEARFEVTTFRREGAYADARHPDHVWFTLDPLADLARRDFTANALAFDPASGELLDPFAGSLDIERHTLRAVGSAADRFHEDGLRALRAARLAAVLEFELEAGTRAALAGARDRVARVAAERVRDEFERLLAAARPSTGFEILREAGLLDLWMPELTACRGVPQNRFHAYDVYFHALYSCDAAVRDKPDVRWAALLHDLGKPPTRVERDGEGTFHGHENVGADLAAQVLERLRFPGARREHIVHLVRHHMFHYEPDWSDAAVRRWLRRVGVENVADLFDLRLADTLGNGLKQASLAPLEAMQARIERVMAAGAVLAVGDLAVNGDDVMRVFGWAPGPSVGRMLRTLLEEVIEQPDRNDRDRLLGRLAQLRAAHGVERTEA